jgi:hypothetical protein
MKIDVASVDGVLHVVAFEEATKNDAANYALGFPF